MTGSRVYFFQSGESGPIKIGVTNNIRRRRDMIQTGAVERIVNLGSYAGDKAEETALHVRFAAHRIRGEWFRPADELLEWIGETVEREVKASEHPIVDHPLRRWRKRQCITLRDVAKMIGLSAAALSRYETGSRKPPAKHIPALVRVTGIPAREFRPDIWELLYGRDQVATGAAQ